MSIILENVVPIKERPLWSIERAFNLDNPALGPNVILIRVSLAEYPFGYPAFRIRDIRQMKQKMMTFHQQDLALLQKNKKRMGNIFFSKPFFIS